MSAVFIHAQWRTGSTYVFSKFRARSDSYFCYYEPIHETVMRAADEPNILLLAGAETCRSLRHPSLGAPYFQELYLTHEAWRQSVYKALVFEETFGDRNGGARRFYEALVGAAQGIPLIQDCRSIFRLKSLGTEVPGLHIHLWRSPRAQYVSYNISNYFHAATRLQITGDNPPAWARALAERFNFPTVRYESVDQEISAQQKFLIHVDAEYFVFFVVWMFSMLEGIAHSGLSISIEELTDSKGRDKLNEVIDALGFPPIDLTDCKIPVHSVAEAPAIDFAKIERSAFAFARDFGCAPADLEELQYRIHMTSGERA